MNSMRFLAILPLAAAFAFALTGCGSAQPLDPLQRESVRESLAKLELPLPLSLGVTVESACFEERDLDTGWGFTPDTGRAREALLSLLRRSDLFRSTRTVSPTGSTSKARDPDADGTDLLLEVKLGREDVEYVERNHLWWPSLALWWMMWFPSWLMPDETYSMNLSGVAVLTDLRKKETLAVIPLSASVTRALNDVERGFHLLGIFRVPLCLGRSDYRSVRRCLEERAWADLHSGLMVSLARTLSP